MITSSGKGSNQHFASVALLLVFGFFLTVLMPELRSLYMQDYTVYNRDGNRDGVPDTAEDMNLNGIADMYEDSDHDGINNVFEKFRPVAKVYAESAGQCIDGIDNDANGFIDGADPGCAMPGSMLEANGMASTNEVAIAPDRETLCADGIDNDVDGMIDAADPDCASVQVSTSSSSSLQSSFASSLSTSDDCSDGLDNDADGMIDKADAGCSCAQASEKNVCQVTGASSSTSKRVKMIK